MSAINRIPVQATANAQGQIVFQFQPVPGALVWSGNVQIPNSPNGAQWVCTISNQQAGSFYGITSMGLQAQGAETIQINGSGLKPGTILTAWFTGVSQTDNGDYAPLAPITNAIVNFPGQTLALDVTNVDLPAIVPYSATFQVQPTDRSVLVIIQNNGVTSNSSGAISIVGSQSGIQWASTFALAGESSAIGTYFGIFPIYGSIDSSAQLQLGSFNIPSADVFIVTLPDEVILGTTDSPLVVTSPYGIASVPFTVDESTGTIAVPFANSAQLIPASGQVDTANVVKTVSFIAAGINTTTNVELVGASSGLIYCATVCPVNGYGSFPLSGSLAITEALNAKVVAGTAGAVDFWGIYTPGVPVGLG